MSRQPLPRGPVTYEEELLARIAVATERQADLLEQLLSRVPAGSAISAPESAAVDAVAVEALPRPARSSRTRK